MARPTRQSFPDIPMHVVQRGNNRQACFRLRNDFVRYLGYLGDAATRYGVSVHAYVLMTNHVHLLVTPSCKLGVSRMMQFVGRSYVRCFNKIHRRTGTLWEGRFKSFVIADDSYLMACHRYIELNPVRAGLVSTPDKYPWSSYRTNASGAASSIIRPCSLYMELSTNRRGRCQAYRQLFGDPEDANRIREIRAKTR